MDINKFYQEFLPIEEHARVEHLEPFDEYEEFSLKCSHYFLCVATKGNCCDMLTNMKAVSMNGIIDENEEIIQAETVTFTSISNSTEGDKTNPYLCSTNKDSSSHGNRLDSIQVYGHAACRLHNDTVVITGGFGEVKKKHTRWQHIVVYDVNSGTIEMVTPCLKVCDTESANTKGKVFSF